MNFPESVRYLYALGNESKGIKLGLERMREVCAALGHPERDIPAIHVAGTNGKGSTCAMIEAGLRAAGMRTGLYTSPHLISPAERIAIDGQAVSEEYFAQLFAHVHDAVRDLSEHPTYFETVTAMAFVAFREAQSDISVLEVGLGGRLDATNVVTPELCVITPVSFDHQSYLGNSLREIAAEKAGILKPGVVAVVAPQEPEAMEVIAKKAEVVGAPLYLVSPESGSGYRPSLAGRHQVENAEAAARALELLKIPAAAIRQGIENTTWPGRLERVRAKPEIFLDGAHNAAGAAALADYIREYRGARKVWLVFGVMRDKELHGITGRLFPLADELILTAPEMDRARRPEEIEVSQPHRIAPTVRDAIRMLEAAAAGDLVFITGSLFLVGEARALLVE